MLPIVRKILFMVSEKSAPPANEAPEANQ